MVKVITYGTFDLLHIGHVKLLERAKALGDYLIVGVTTGDFDRQRGKINVRQSLDERVAAVRSTGIADKVIVEEYEGQKIDDIKRYGVDIFTVGSDWQGCFDYLNEYCQVFYLPRTEGVSSSALRTKHDVIRLGLMGYSTYLERVYEESKFVNGMNVIGLCSEDPSKLVTLSQEIPFVASNYHEMLDCIDAVYVHSHPLDHFMQVYRALEKGKHVLCESPVALDSKQVDYLVDLARSKGLVLMEGIRTAYMLAYSRLLLLVKSGAIGEVISVDATCTSLATNYNFAEGGRKWGSLWSWGPTALLPVLQLLGTNWERLDFFTLNDSTNPGNDAFTKIVLTYATATATVKLGTGIKAEGDLVIAGTKGYVYVPAPWWKTDYFELRYERPEDMRRKFYQLDGDGIRYELVEFARAARGGRDDFYIERDVTRGIARIMREFQSRAKHG